MSQHSQTSGVYFNHFDNTNLQALRNQVHIKGKISTFVENHHLAELEKNCAYYQNRQHVDATKDKKFRPFLTTLIINFNDLLKDESKFNR